MQSSAALSAPLFGDELTNDLGMSSLMTWA